MNTAMIRRLELRAALEYTDCDTLKVCEPDKEHETMFCFEVINPHSIEPDSGNYLGKLLLKGIESGLNTDSSPECNNSSIPAGIYFFYQEKKHLDKQACLEAAMEIQKEALWQSQKPGNSLFIRYLHEDDTTVTQLLMPLMTN